MKCPSYVCARIYIFKRARTEIKGNKFTFRIAGIRYRLDGGNWPLRAGRDGCVNIAYLRYRIDKAAQQYGARTSYSSLA